jgi:hypothetical protein
MFEDRMPNKSVIAITVHTSFKPQIEDGEDGRKEIVQRFHDAVFKVVEHFLTENEDLEQDIMEELQEDWLPKKTLEFSDLGEIAISVSEEMSELKQENMSEEDVKFHLAKLNKPKLPKSQTKLMEVEARCDANDDGIPPTVKTAGILPNEL